MTTYFARFTLGALVWAMACLSVAAEPAAMIQTLSRLAPTLNKKVLNQAVTAMDCAIKQGFKSSEKLAVIDFSLPSTQPRLWIFDLKSSRLLLKELVAHGKNSGQKFATRFSNQEGSHQSSLGLFLTGERYTGKHGLSLRMDGLEPGFNDKARDRAIVIHGASYVDPNWIPVQGRIGRSLGCPAVRKEIAPQVVDSLSDGQFVFSYFPDERWLQGSPYLNCGSRQVTITKAQPAKEQT